MAENDDKMKDLKSRLGLVSQGGVTRSASKPKPAEAVESPTAEEPQESAPAEPVVSTPMAAPTRQMSADEMTAYQREAQVDMDVVAAGKKGPMLIVGIVIAVVCYGIGQFIGGNLADRALLDRVKEDRESVFKTLERKNPDTGETQLDRIKAQVAATNEVLEKLKAIEDGDQEEMEKILGAYFSACAAFEDTMDFSSLYGQGFMAAKMLPEMTALAGATQRYQERVKGIASMGAILSRLKTVRVERFEDPGYGRKKLFVQVGSAKISQPDGTSVDVPMAWGEWLKGDISGFQEMPAPDLGRNATQWSTKGLLMGEKEPKMLPTAQIADVDMRLFLESVEKGAYREVLTSVLSEIEELQGMGQTLALDRLTSSDGQ